MSADVKEATDEALMAAYQTGERAAFAEIFRRYGPRLARLFRRDMRTADADDLVQQTFLQLHRARHDFRTAARLRPWLYTIALNTRRQYFRRLGRRSESDVDRETHGEPVATSGDPETAVRDAQLRAALRELPRTQRQVIILHWFEGLTFREVAQVVGASHSAVRVRAHRGYEKLRTMLGPDAVTDRPSGAYASKG